MEVRNRYGVVFGIVIGIIFCIVICIVFGIVLGAARQPVHISASRLSIASFMYVAIVKD